MPGVEELVLSDLILGATVFFGATCELEELALSDLILGATAFFCELELVLATLESIGCCSCVGGCGAIAGLGSFFFPDIIKKP